MQIKTIKLIVAILMAMGCKDKQTDVIIVVYTNNTASNNYTITLDGFGIGQPPYSKIAPSCSNTNKVTTVKSGTHKLYFKHYHAAALDKEKIIEIPNVDCYAINCDPSN